MEAFNHHQLRTEHHWSPYQMWINGMLNELNPLAGGQLDDAPQDLEYYGIDSDGPSPFENSDNDVVVPTVACELIISQLPQSFWRESIR